MDSIHESQVPLVIRVRNVNQWDGCVKPFLDVRPLHPPYQVDFNGFRLEKFFGELGQSVGIVGLTTEDVYISGIGQICKMA